MNRARVNVSKINRIQGDMTALTTVRARRDRHKKRSHKLFKTLLESVKYIDNKTQLYYNKCI